MTDPLTLTRARNQARRDFRSERAKLASTEDIIQRTFPLTALSTSTFSRQYLMTALRGWRVVAAALRSTTDLAASTTNYWDLQVRVQRDQRRGRTYKDIVLANGPLRYWPMDWPGGYGSNWDWMAVTDLTHGSGASAGAAGPRGCDGELAVSYDGTANGYSSMASTDLAWGNTLTIEGWVYLPSVSTRQTMFGAENAASQPQIEVGSLGAGQMKVIIPTDGSVVNVGSTGLLLRASDWQHIMYTRNGTGTGVTDLFVDGVHVPFSETGSNFVDTAAQRVIGRRASGSQPLLAGSRVAHHALFNKALTQDDARRRYGTVLAKGTNTSREGEAITAERPWYFDLKEPYTPNNVMRPGDQLMFEAHNIGTSAGALAGLYLDVAFEPVSAATTTVTA